MINPRACDRCLTRSWLLLRLAGHLGIAPGQIEATLALDDDELIRAVAGDKRDAVIIEHRRVDADRLRANCERACVTLICRCDARYPRQLTDLRSPPAVIHVAGDLGRFLEAIVNESVAVVGARRGSPYGSEIARSLGRGLSAAGLSVISGMALGIDSAAHAGALEASGSTVAVLPGGPERSYPAEKRRLHADIVKRGAAVSELPPGTAVRRWMFPARNRIIAALASMTVVVEASERSGALLTAGFARGLGRPVGAVPGNVSCPVASGSNGLLAAGAYVVRDPQDVLDALFGAGARSAPRDQRPELAPELRPLLAAIGSGHDTAAALAQAGFEPGAGLAALAALELTGHVRRQPGGRFSVVP